MTQAQVVRLHMTHATAARERKDAGLKSSSRSEELWWGGMQRQRIQTGVNHLCRNEQSVRAAFASDWLRSTIDILQRVPAVLPRLVWPGAKLISPVSDDLLPFRVGALVVAWQILLLQEPTTTLEQRAAPASWPVPAETKLAKRPPALRHRAAGDHQRLER